ncbi:NEL-type E3 ubiquitin ligase domain-containing protein [Pseudomonas guariconensis]|uniref:NEL-type E3 ubiquitin ligase domain-containing protein n=1 Tax=Pseudomonas guariconensis TaxID=1288410 RepID=UPI0018A9F884|nr:NEL-type E3 ubiquitin ligase domain-containing protein [Pseudomonas guariconensis]MBF8720261.1 hypothetical protein [Pseudomonas guariconensis]
MGNVSQGVDTLAVAQQFQDRLIARRLPGWITQVHDMYYLDLVEALEDGLASRQRLVRYWARIEQIDVFGKRMLQAAIHEQVGADVDIDTQYFRRQYFFTSPEQSPWAGRLPLQDTDYYDVPLLSAALRNFTLDETKPDGQPKHNRLVDVSGNTVAQPSARAFAELCRTLDLGVQYQQHLDSVFKSSAGNGLDFKQSIAQLQRSSMLLDAFKAYEQDVLSWDELGVVIALYRHGKPGGLGGAPVIACRLRAFACDLQQIVVLVAVEEHQLANTSQRVLVHIPGDPHGPWHSASNINDFARGTLAKRLAQSEYRQFFRRFVRYRDSQRFFSAALSRLDNAVALKIEGLDESLKAYPRPLFEYLAAARVAQVKDDAAMIATPVARLDRAVQKAHDQRLEAEGRTLLEMAQLFVPEVGEILHLAHVWSMLEEVFHAIEDWRDGDTTAALDHVVHVIDGMTLSGGVGEGFDTLRSNWARAEVVDQLVPVLLEDGTEKLWNQDLAPFLSEPPAEAASDELGVRSLGERHWIEIDGQFYEVLKRDHDTWHLKSQDGHAPEVLHNQAGAWRLWCEQPVEWTDARRMFRRLGGAFGKLRDEQIDQVMAIHGLDADYLRGLHVYARAPDAELVDTVQRVRLVNRVYDLASRLHYGQPILDQALLSRVRDLRPTGDTSDDNLADLAWTHRRELFQHLYRELDAVTDDTRLLRQTFAGLHRLAAEQLLHITSDDDLQALENGQVPPRLAEWAGVHAARIRSVRAFEALCFEIPQGLDLARLAVSLLEAFPDAVAGPGWELIVDDGQAPSLRFQGEDVMFSLICQDGQFLLRDDQGRDIGEPGELFLTLASAFAQGQDEGSGEDETFALTLRARLVGLLLDHREQVAQALANGRAFLALPDLSVEHDDYTLSSDLYQVGKRQPKSLQTRLRYFYPDFSDEEVEQWLQGIRNKSQVPGVVLGELKVEYRALCENLNYWVWVNALSSPREIKCRRLAKALLLKAWKRLIPRKTRARDEPDDTLTIAGVLFSRLTTLPSLFPGVEFPHVSELLLRAMPLKQIPSTFLAAFVNLRRLEVTGCKIERVPLHKAFDTKLNVLDLSNNKIDLDGIQSTWVSRCRSLVYLNMSNNPLGRAPDIRSLPMLNTLLLNNANLASIPTGIVLHARISNFDIRGNARISIPSTVVHSQLWAQGRVRIDDALYAPEPRDWQEPRWSEVPMRLRWQDRVDPTVRDSMALAWVELEQYPEAHEFFTLVARVARSIGFSNEDHATDLANRLYTLMVDLMDDPALRTHLFALAVNAHCEDNAITCFSNLEINRTVWAAERDGVAEEALVGLLGRLWRLDQVDEAAREHALNMRGDGREAVEALLYFRIGLNDALDLGLNRLTIRHPFFAEADEETLDAIRDRITSEQTESILVEALLQRSVWVSHLEKTYGHRFEVPQALQDEYSTLCDAGDDEGAAQLWGVIQAVKPGMLRTLTSEALRKYGASWKVPIIYDLAI